MITKGCAVSKFTASVYNVKLTGYATFNMPVPAPQNNCHRWRCIVPGPKTSIVRGNSVGETSVKRRNKIVQEITQNVANVFNFYALIAIENGFSMH